MTEGKTAWLPGDIYDGIEGLKWIPGKDLVPALPKELGDGIRNLAKHLQERPERTKKLVEVFQRISASHGNLNLDSQLLELARPCQWPLWVRECFWPILQEGKGELVVYWIDGELYSVLKERFPREKMEVSWNGVYWKLATSTPKVIELLDAINAEMELMVSRRSLPIKDHEKAGMCQSALSLVAERMTPQEKKELDAARLPSLPKGIRDACQAGV